MLITMFRLKTEVTQLGDNICMLLIPQHRLMMVGVVSDYNLLALDSISGNVNKEPAAHTCVSSNYQPSLTCSRKEWRRRRMVLTVKAGVGSKRYKHTSLFIDNQPPPCSREEDTRPN
ncbi:hypothetical protein HID58_058117 [Brassica napus]|uniref:Uncharacterized protein n=1 Tax=Brassica napus TaxID=3708 RepID=A0ABQ7ZPR5_BRANA|nr:hypothetical protein HID58_058117 [Brassica napus]